jgi:hypothetical protein
MALAHIAAFRINQTATFSETAKAIAHPESAIASSDAIELAIAP